MSRLSFAPAVALALSALGCASVPIGSRAAVRTALHADHETVAPGDTVHFLAQARNPTEARIHIGPRCSPALDVMVTRPGGVRQSLLASTVGTNGVLACEPARAHVVAPGDSSVIMLRWVAPAQRGEYLARAGLRDTLGLSNLSDPVSVVVR
jgi:hypothetical protein